MGIRGELFSTSVILPKRTYFFNVKENRMGDLYLNIVESKNRDTGGFDRQSVVLFADDLQEFLKGFDESLKILEKSVRGKKREKPAAGPNFGSPKFGAQKFGGQKFGDSNRSAKQPDGKKVFKRNPAEKSSEKFAGKNTEKPFGKPAGKFAEKPAKNRRETGNKRVVVKKREK